MKRWMTWTVGVGAALAASAATLVGVTGTAQSATEPFPEDEGWVEADERIRIPAGYACARAVRFRAWGHFRLTINGEPFTEDTQPGPGDRVFAEGPDWRVRVTNLHNDRRVTVDAGGTIADVVMPNGKNLRGVGDGANVWFGPRITGILYADGKVNYSVLDFAEPTGQFFTTHTEGVTRDLCSAVGTRPVQGKTLPDPGAGGTAERRHFVR